MLTGFLRARTGGRSRRSLAVQEPSLRFRRTSDVLRWSVLGYWAFEVRMSVEVSRELHDATSSRQTKAPIRKFFALVAQGIEHRFPKPVVARSNRAEGSEESSREIARISAVSRLFSFVASITADTSSTAPR